MRKGSGYVLVSDPDGGGRESDCFTCVHCQRIVEVPPKATAKSVGWCLRCDKPICRRCADDGNCKPWDRQMDAMERRDRLYRDMRQ